MSTHSIVETRNQLSDLIDRALQGEEIVVTRHGRPVVRLAAIPKIVAPITPADLDWIAARRVPRLKQTIDAATLVREMRDED